LKKALRFTKKKGISAFPVSRPAKIKKTVGAIRGRAGLFNAQDLFPDRSKSRTAASSKLAASGVTDIELAGADLQ